jgi:RHS repeat-associated protein
MAGTYASFDRFGRITRQLWHRYKSGDTDDLVDHLYDYDYNSNRLWKDNIAAGDASKKLDELYAYDKLDRLIDFQRGKLNEARTQIPTTDDDRMHREEWTLSPTGNWNEYKRDGDGWTIQADGDYTDTTDLDQDREHNKVNEIEDTTGDGDAITEAAGSAWIDPAYSGRGNMTKLPYVVAPHLMDLRCKYDAWNRLMKIDVHINGQYSATRAEYEYDGLGRRIRQKALAGDDWDHYYYNNAWQVLEVRRDAAEGDPVVRHQYVWSPRYIDAPILRDENKDGDSDCINGDDERLYYCNDVNMNVVALVNTSGEAVERYRYDAYGWIPYALHGVKDVDGTDTSASEWEPRPYADSFVNEIGFCGYWYDPYNFINHVRHRAYYPNRGWLQRDSLGYVDGMSLYEYVGSGPVGHTDPAGLGEVAQKMGWADVGLHTQHPPTTGEIFATATGFLEEQGVLDEIGGFYNTVMELHDTGLERGEDSSDWEYGKWDNDVVVPPANYGRPGMPKREGRFVFSSETEMFPEGKRDIQRANQIESLIAELWHAYWDQHLEEDCPKVYGWLVWRAVHNGYGLGTATATRKRKGGSKLTKKERLEALEEAISETLSLYVGLLLDLELTPEKFKHLPIPPLRTSGHLNLPNGGIDKDTKVLGKEEWTVVRFIVKHGCNANTDHYEILRTPESKWGGLANKWSSGKAPGKR